MIERSNENSLQTGFEQISEKKISQEFCFLMKNSLTLMMSRFLMWAINRANADEKSDVMQKQVPERK